MTFTPKTPDEAKKKKKRRLILVIVIVSALAAVSYVLTSFPELFSRRKNQNVTTMYSDRNISYLFYESDYDLDPFADETYMQYDRLVHYTDGAVTVGLTEEEAADYNDAVRFFVRYFKTVVAGDAATYNTFFTERYYKNAKPYDRFAPQMIYDIHVEQLSETAQNDGSTVWTFNVAYKIYRNDGSFRNDIPSDGAKTLRFTLIGNGAGDVKIDAIDYYRHG